MNLKKLVAFLVLSVFFIPAGFVFAEENNLEIDEGKNLKFDFKGFNAWYDDTQVYDNVNIGAGTKVILNSDWEVMYKGVGENENEYIYAQEENLATLSINEGGKIILNSGSELSIRNEYSLVTKLYDVSLQYMQNPYDDEEIDISSTSFNRGLHMYEGAKRFYFNRETDFSAGDVDNYLFTGDIVFEDGDAETTLTFRKVSDVTSEDYILPEAAEGDTITEVPDLVSLDNENNIAHMTNNFIINSNRAVFNVEGDGVDENGVTRRVVYLDGSKLSGNGTFVKKGAGWLSLAAADGMDLTGENSGGLGWSIEEGMVIANFQSNLGNSAIYIANGGSLGLSSPGITLNPSQVINQIKNDELETNKFGNTIFSSNGGISITGGDQVELTGQIKSEEGKDSLSFSFVNYSLLKLSGEQANDIKHFYIHFGNKELGGGESNYLVTDVANLADESVTVVNGITEDCIEKETAFFELVLKEDEDLEYSGSLKGEMYLRKLGDGLVTISGENTYDRGTYITEGGLLLATSNSIGTGNILFDGGVKGDTTTYASIGVSSITTSGDVILTNNIHVKNGAILNVAERQNLFLKGDLVSYDARPGYETEFIKNGLGNTTIAGIEGVDRQINISSFTITEGGFILDKGVVLDSYFSLDGEQAFLEMKESAEVKNNAIDINNGDLIIFNDKCISSATAVNFYNEATSTEAFSKFHIKSDSVISNETVAGSIAIAQNIEFVIGETKEKTDENDVDEVVSQAEGDTEKDTATVIVQMDKITFNKNLGVDPTIVKSGDGDLIAEGNGDFALDSLYVNGGKIRIENMDMTVSSTTLLDGGILSISSTSHFASTASTAEEKKITVLDGGGIGIYDDNSIDGDTKLSFEGTDEQNLSRLIIESDENVTLSNSIYVKTGLIIENEKTLTFSGDSIDYDPSAAGILAKDGAGDMIIDSDGIFRMGQLNVLGGNLLVKSDIDVGSISIEGENALLSFEDVNNASIADNLSLASGGTLSVSTSTLNLEDLRMISGTIINNNSVINADVIDCSSSLIELTKDTSVINARTINLRNTVLEGFGNLNATVNVGNGSSVYIGSDGETGEKLKAKNVVFESGSSLYIDVDSQNGVTTTDVLEVAGDITVQSNSTLYVNLGGDDSEYDGTLKEFEFITFGGSYSFENTTNKIFDIILSNPKFSASTALIGNSIFLAIAQEWEMYSIPGVTKNQEEMIDLFNKIASDDVASRNMESVLSTLNQYYSNYIDTGDKAAFLNALQDLSGIFYSNSFMASTMFSKAGIIYNRLNDYSERREDINRVWAQVYTTNFTVAENEENPKFENNMYGLLAGYDTIKEDNLIFGIAGFYGQGELKQMDDKADVIDAGLNAYGDYKINDSIDIKGLIGYSMQDYDTTRKLRFNKQEITSKYATNTVSLDIEAGYKYDFNDRVSIRPIVGANCAIVSNGDIEEDGNTEQRLKINKNTYSKAEARVGVGLQSRAVSPFNWYVSTAIKQILSGDKFTTKGSFMNVPDYEFEIESTKLSGTSFSGGLGCAYDINSNLNISLDLSVDAGAASQVGANIGASYKW